MKFPMQSMVLSPFAYMFAGIIEARSRVVNECLGRGGRWTGGWGSGLQIEHGQCTNREKKLVQYNLVALICWLTQCQLAQ